jgi:hypothetical protein
MFRPALIILGFILVYVFADAQSPRRVERSQNEMRSFSPAADNELFAANAAPKGKKKSPKKKTNKPCDGEQFDGQDRKRAKLSIGSGQLETFDDLKALLAQLPTDKFMGTEHDPPIMTDSTSVRVDEEQRNVHVKQAWIYTYTREGDEDYHVILGTDPKAKKKTFFDMEVSGLPSPGASDESDLKKARDEFTNHFGITGCISSYTEGLFAHPVEVEVTGSLFFDKLHFKEHSVIGHGIAKPKRYWEIHPATEIIFK